MLHYEESSEKLLQNLQEQQHELLQQKQSLPVVQEKITQPKSEKTLVLTTQYGEIRIQLRPDLSQSSVDYIHRVIESKICRRCNFYRAEKAGILQGILANKDAKFNTERGPCPPGSESIRNDCPKWDPQCGCHGPILTRGMVAWVEGKGGGPDFFINNYQQPANFWGTQHTTFGEIEDQKSLSVVDQIFTLPVQKRDGMSRLEDSIPFEIRLE